MSRTFALKMLNVVTSSRVVSEIDDSGFNGAFVTLSLPKLTAVREAYGDALSHRQFLQIHVDSLSGVVISAVRDF